MISFVDYLWSFVLTLKFSYLLCRRFVFKIYILVKESLLCCFFSLMNSCLGVIYLKKFVFFSPEFTFLLLYPTLLNYPLIKIYLYPIHFVFTVEHLIYLNVVYIVFNIFPPFYLVYIKYNKHNYSWFLYIV